MDGPVASTNPLSSFQSRFNQRLQHFLDKSSPHITPRWIGLAVVVLAYLLRVWYLRGFYIVTYGLGIYNLNLVLGFLTPQIDPETEGPELPTKSDQEFRPFIRRLPEFKFWYSAIKSVFVGLFMTFFKFFDVPVFWPILLLYWFVLFFVTMKRQIRHMIKYRYLPFSWGKKKYTGKPGERRPEKDAKDGSRPASSSGTPPAPSSTAPPASPSPSGPASGPPPVSYPTNRYSTTASPISGPVASGPPASFPTNRFPGAAPLMNGSPASTHQAYNVGAAGQGNNYGFI